MLILGSTLWIAVGDVLSLTLWFADSDILGSTLRFVDGHITRGAVFDKPQVFLFGKVLVLTNKFF